MSVSVGIHVSEGDSWTGHVERDVGWLWYADASAGGLRNASIFFETAEQVEALIAAATDLRDRLRERDAATAAGVPA